MSKRLGKTPKWEGGHYHIVLKLTGPKHRKSMKESIPSNEGIVVNFSDKHDNYYSVYRYIYRDDDYVHHSKHHPNLDNVASPGWKNQPNPINNLENHMLRKILQMFHKKETGAESKIKETSNPIRSQWVFSKKMMYVRTLSTFTRQTKEKREDG